VLAGGVACLVAAAPAHAQPVLIDASPAPSSVLIASPQEIILTFDRALVAEGTSIRVTDESGQRVDDGEMRIDPANRFATSVGLQPLPEGRYNVVYTAVGVGSSTVQIGTYEFTVDLPPPTLEQVTPVDGDAFDTGTIPLQMRVQNFNFAQYESRIRVYVDGRLDAELRSLDYSIEGLSPGVHEIRTVLARFENEELPETAITVHVAVAQPDPESEGLEHAAQLPPDSGLQLTLPQTIGLVLLTLALLGLGLWLGRPSPA
jgi:methionine-rich copper-binding protein CopC